jgi:single-strand DNA-binding protein
MYQKTIIVGNVGRDADARFTPQGSPVTSFTVATSYKHDGEAVTTWFRVTTWGKLAETCAEYVKKGMKILVEGRLQCDPSTGGPRVWIDKAGKTQTSFEVTAVDVRFLSSSKEPATEQSAPADDLPF